jgi:hypothetical protein
MLAMRQYGYVGLAVIWLCWPCANMVKLALRQYGYVGLKPIQLWWTCADILNFIVYGKLYPLQFSDK